MKITGAKIYIDNNGPFKVGKHHMVFVRLYTDEGIYGVGEPIVYGVGIPAVAEYIKELAGLLIGRDPFETEAIWHRFRGGWEALGGPLTISAISAIDIALWDIKGKALGVPVYKLLGGKVREKVPVYLSHIEFGYPDTDQPPITPEEFETVARRARDKGYQYVKANFFRYDAAGNVTRVDRYHPFDQDFYKLIRERMLAVQQGLGSDGEIIIENNAMTGLEDAYRTIEAARGTNILFFEEPVEPDPHQMKLVAEKSPFPLATGERIPGRTGILPFLENRSTKVLMPDVCNTGGITEFKKVADLAESFGASISSHTCGGPINQAASIHLGAVIPNFLLHEHHVHTLNDYNFKYGLYKYDATDGLLEVPELPGLGQDISPDVLDRFDVFTVGEVKE
jgi:L-alanine-DL-glutamate epimerase-like enolase superfamily enzyme